METDRTLEEQREKLRRELVRDRKRIKNSLENWYLQADAAIEDWDGGGSPPILYGSIIEQKIAACETAIADEIELRG